MLLFPHNPIQEDITMGTTLKKKWKFMKLDGVMNRQILVSDAGDIVHTRTKKALKTSRMYKRSNLNGSDYLSVQIDGQKIRTHRIVCETFNGPAPKGRMLVNHIDEIKNNNTAKNLRWVSASENMTAYYQNHIRSLYPNKTISAIKRLVNKGMTNDSIATKMKVSDSLVSSIKLGFLHVEVKPFTKQQFIG